MPMAAGRPRVHPGYRPETGGLLSHDCLLRTAPGWQPASPEQANQRVRMRGQPKRETTVFLLPNIRSDTRHFFQTLFTSIPSLNPTHTLVKGMIPGNA